MQINTLTYKIFFFKHETAYERRISDWSSDMCSSDLALRPAAPGGRRIRDRARTRRLGQRSEGPALRAAHPDAGGGGGPCAPPAAGRQTGSGGVATTGSGRTAAA